LKLRTLELSDFRQFRGTQTLHFADATDRSVTLIYGANGTGKTTLLNAFTWALYGEFTPDLEHPERPINQRAWDEAGIGDTLTAEVQLEFEHGGSIYSVRRSARAEKEGPHQRVEGSEVSLDVTDESGRTVSRGGAEDALDQILPKRLHGFFFFNGERIERLAQQTAYEEIEQATKTLLGLEAIERALRHLPKAAQKFEKELKKVGSTEQQGIAERLERLRGDRATAIESRDEARRNAVASAEERERIAARLRELEDVRELQEERDSLEKEFETNKGLIGAARDSVASVISDRGYLAFLSGLGDDVKASVGDLEARGELPTPLKRPFVEELLTNGECICGTPLVEGEASFAKVAEYRDRAGLADVEQRWITLRNEAEHVLIDRNALKAGLDRALLEVEQLRTKQMAVEERLSELSGKLSDFPSEEIRALEAQHEKLREQERDWIRREGARQSDHDRLETEIATAEDELSKMQAKSDEAAKAQRRVHAAHAAEHVFQEIYELLQDEVRKELDSRIKKTFKGISFKDREPELNEAFELRLWDTNGEDRLPAAKSTGENMILSLSFVGGLASLARDQEQMRGGGRGLEALLSGAGGTYPIVMDAAFGNLDQDYREDVARALPQLAPQAVVLVSKAQAAGEVQRELRDKVGRAYVISYRTPKEGEDEEIDIDGRVYPYKVSTSPGDERAELVEVGANE
jgi:DNA sulfur modification protein DndD